MNLISFLGANDILRYKIATWTKRFEGESLGKTWRCWEIADAFFIMPILPLSCNNMKNMWKRALSCDSRSGWFHPSHIIPITTTTQAVKAIWCICSNKNSGFPLNADRHVNLGKIYKAILDGHNIMANKSREPRDLPTLVYAPTNARWYWMRRWK